MHLVGGRRVFAATDLSNFLSCAHLSGLARNVSRLPWLALALLAACSDAGQGVDSSIPVTELTSSRVLARDELRGEAAISVLPWNGRVFVGVMGADSVIAVYEPSGRVVRHYGPEGDGPGELRSPGNLVPWQDGIWIWDPRSGRGSILRPGGNPPIEPVWTIPDGERYLRAQPTDSGVVLSDSYFEPGLFSIWRQGMATPQPRGALPPLAAANWDTPWGLNPSYAVLSPDGERIAVVFSHTGEVVIASVPTGAVLATSRTSDWDIEIDAQEFRPSRGTRGRGVRPIPRAGGACVRLAGGAASAAAAGSPGAVVAAATVSCSRSGWSRCPRCVCGSCRQRRRNSLSGPGRAGTIDAQSDALCSNMRCRCCTRPLNPLRPR